MPGTSRPPPGSRPAQQTEVGDRGDSSSGGGAGLAMEQERTRRVIAFALLGVIGLVALGSVVCIAMGRLSVAEVAVILGGLTALARRPLAFLFPGERMS